MGHGGLDLTISNLPRRSELPEVGTDEPLIHVPVGLAIKVAISTVLWFKSVLTEYLKVLILAIMTRPTDALVVHSVGADPELTPVTLDTLRPTEALVEVHATGICHTDIACMEGKLPARFPNVLGHEGALFFPCQRMLWLTDLGGGVVLEVGAAVKDVKAGDKVLLSYNFCGDCTHCTEGYPAYCESMIPLNFGGQRLDGTPTVSLAAKDSSKPVYANFFGQSTFSRVALVSGSSLVCVPDSTPLELFAPLGCGLQTGASSIFKSLDVKPGSKVAIFGAGCVGLSAVMAAKIRGAGMIIAVDIQPDRLELARELGATHLLNGKDKDLLQQIQGLCKPAKGVDFALDCSGVLSVIETMIDSLGMRGRATSAGAPAPGQRVGVDVFSHLVAGKEYVGCHQGGSVAAEVRSSVFVSWEINSG